MYLYVHMLQFSTSVQKQWWFPMCFVVACMRKARSKQINPATKPEPATTQDIAIETVLKKNDTDVFDFDLEKKAHMTWTTAPNIIEIYFMTIFFIQTLVKGSFSRRFFSDFFMCSQRLNSYSLSKTFFYKWTKLNKTSTMHACSSKEKRFNKDWWITKQVVMIDIRIKIIFSSCWQ